MGVTFHTEDTFIFSNTKTARAFAAEWDKKERTETYGAHFNVDCPIFLKKDFAYTVTLSTEGYGVPDLTEFRDKGAYAVVRTITSCQGQGIYKVYALLNEDFSYELSDPYEEEDELKLDSDSYFPDPLDSDFREQKEDETDAAYEQAEDFHSQGHYDHIIHLMDLRHEELTQNMLVGALR